MPLTRFFHSKLSRRSRVTGWLTLAETQELLGSGGGVDYSFEETIAEAEQTADWEVSPGLYTLTATMLSFDADGETLGGDDGEVVLDISSFLTAVSQAALSVPEGGGNSEVDHALNAAVSHGSSTWFIARPLRAAQTMPLKTHELHVISAGWVQALMSIWDGFDEASNPYAGSNSPTATWRFDLVSL